MIEDLAYLVNIDSPSDNPGGLKKCMDFFYQAFKTLNWTTEIVPTGQNRNCLKACNKQAQKYDFLLTGHLDTVFPEGTASKRPYTQEGSFAYGPGVCDMKSGCLTILYALKALPEKELKEKSFLVILQDDEEIGSPQSRKLLQEAARNCQVCLVFEAAEDASDAISYHCIERKGIIRFAFSFTGKAGHAGNLLHNNALSAITEMAYWIGQIASLTNPQTGTTSNVGTVKGGSASNVVAESSSMSGEIRFETLEEKQKAEDLILSLFEHATEAGIRVTKELFSTEDPLVPSKKTIQFVKEIEKKTSLDFFVRKRGGLSAANFTGPLCPVCIDGLGPAGGKAHSEEEFMRLDNLEPSLILVKEILSMNLDCLK